MFDPAKPVRLADRNSTLSVKIVATLTKSEQFRGQPMLVVIVTDPMTGKQNVGYRNLDGTHPNQSTYLNLVNIDTSPVAHLYQTMDSEPANALRVLWKHDQFGPVIDVMTGLDPTLNRSEVRSYFEGLWG